MNSVAPLPATPNDPALRRSLSDRVHEALFEEICDLRLPPGARLSEAEVAARLGVSRQPVRDAFSRLEHLGFLVIRPQRATLVAPIREDAVLQAAFIRTALERACVRAAAGRLDAARLDALQAIVAEQAEAVAAGDGHRFTRLDDEFHRGICVGAALDFAWTLVRDTKGHMDRVRYLSATQGGATALADHRRVLAALRAGDADAAGDAMEAHLARIAGSLARCRAEFPDAFDP